MRPRRGMLIGALSVAVGVVIAGTAPVLGTAPAAAVHAPQTLGGGLVVFGWALLVWSIHRFGRESRRDDT